MRNQLVTVFGGSGFLGRHTVRALAKAGYRIRVAVRRPATAHFLPPMGHVGQIQLMRCNVRDAEQLAEALKGAHAAVNLTGILFPRGEQSFEAIHVEAAQSIARSAAEAGVAALAHVSAIGADPDANSHYASTKGEGEARVREAFAGASVLRPSVVFGPEDRFFNKFAQMARVFPVLPLIGGGRTKFQPVFVGDVASAIVRCLEDPAAKGRVYELGGPAVRTFKDLMQFILRETGRRRLLAPVPFFLATAEAFVLEIPSMILPIDPLLTVDQVRMLKSDNVVRPDAPGLRELGVDPDTIEAIVPSYLWRYRPKGQFDRLVTGREVAPR
ncbi:MAG TPA: complex I NDUFA9 subunit family protein [Rhizomicrobium sp.]|nr:complex I NDUFA9 subunit family protein [Rhizomicrobium sp.]